MSVEIIGHDQFVMSESNYEDKIIFMTSIRMQPEVKSYRQCIEENNLQFLYTPIYVIVGDTIEEVQEVNSKLISDAYSAAYGWKNNLNKI